MPDPLVQPKRVRWVLRAASAPNRATVAASSSLSRACDATISRCLSFNSPKGFAPPAPSIIAKAGDPLISSYVRRKCPIELCC